MTLRTDLEALVASWPYTEAKAALRVADILAGKPADYWTQAGRERVERELAEDGLPPERIDAVILTVEGVNITTEEVSLDRILADLIARERS